MSDPKIVDTYTINVVERDGFKFVVIGILTDDQKAQSYEFAPAFAYQLSNELLKASAIAANKTKTG